MKQAKQGELLAIKYRLQSRCVQVPLCLWESALKDSVKANARDEDNK